MNLAALTDQLRAGQGVRLKRDIALVADALAHAPPAAWLSDAHGVSPTIYNGDDAAAIADGDGYTLLAAEGMLPSFVAQDPWFAGFSSVMVNVSDILAMGGRPFAVVDVLFAGESAQVSTLLAGMRAASDHFGVPVVGGHTSRTQQTDSTLAVAIVGRARTLLESRAARPGDALIAAFDVRGRYRGAAPFFDAATSSSKSDWRRAAEVLPALAEAGLAHAAKDVSMAGTPGTLTMLCEASGTGATLDLDSLPIPEGVSLARWLVTFPSYGFLLAAPQEHVLAVQRRFADAGIAAAHVGDFDASRRVELELGQERALFWDLRAEALTGFGPSPA